MSKLEEEIKNLKIGDCFEDYKIIGIKTFDSETIVYLKERENAKKKRKN